MYTVSESNDRVAIVQDRFATRQLDIDDYRVLNRDAPELAAGFLTHVLTEYTVAAVTHIPFNFEVLFQISHQVALSEEAKAVSDMTGKLTTPRSDNIIQGSFQGPSMTSRDDYTSIQYDVIFKTGANGRTTQLESVTRVKPNKKGSSKP